MQKVNTKPAPNRASNPKYEATSKPTDSDPPLCKGATVSTKHRLEQPFMPPKRRNCGCSTEVSEREEPIVPGAKNGYKYDK